MSTNCILTNQIAVGFKDVYCKTLVIPEGVISIKNGAFRDYYGLEEVIFPSTLVEIGARAFENCTNLKYISLPFEVSNLGIDVFAGCHNLICADLLYTQIRVIPDSAFSGCKSLEGVFLPDSVERICKNAFLSCDKLTYVYTPKQLKIFECIPKSKLLSLISIPNEVIHIEDISLYSFENTEFILSQHQFNRFYNALPASAKIHIDNSYSNINRLELILEQQSNLMDYVINSLSISSLNDDNASYIGAYLEMVKCMCNCPSKIEISKIKFYDNYIEHDIITTITFEKKEYHYHQIKSGVMNNTVRHGPIDQQRWKEFEVLCASDTSLYKQSYPLSDEYKHFWRVEIIYSNGKILDYSSTNFDNEGYLTLFECFGECIETTQSS